MTALEERLQIIGRDDHRQIVIGQRLIQIAAVEVGFRARQVGVDVPRFQRQHGGEIIDHAAIDAQLLRGPIGGVGQRAIVIGRGVVGIDRSAPA